MTGASRVAVVSGANRGIGREVTRQLAQRGFTVILGSRELDPGSKAAEEFNAEGLNVVAHQLDITEQSSVDSLASYISEEHGCLDAVVNNAAIHYDTWQRASTADVAVVAEAWETNVVGPWRFCLALLPLLRNSDHARIVNVSSEAGSLTNMGGGIPAYRVTKTALNALTRMLAAELRPEGILVNAVCPGWVSTEMGGPGGRPVTDGAASVLWAIDLGDDGPSGGFFRDGRPLPW
jgi:NAD(P)-dependent dehydrogenase (short-subunit alcohol dehydrogenase family)